VQQVRDRIELVWTGQEIAGSESRDTAVVAANPALRVRMFLNVQRPHGNEEPETVLLKRFMDTFRRDIWVGNRLPEIFYDPRSLQGLRSKSLAIRTETKACLHAKCVVVDEERVLITSANFTEAAHERNIEAGLLLADAAVAKAVCSQFESLVARFKLKSVACSHY
jgi:phosphatidylserine/phosphatidylglycerophosphate/cardiolipin synthase-like enzyme